MADTQKSQKRFTIIQKPNLPFIVWVICTVLVRLVPDGVVQDLLQLISFGSLFTWAWLEIFDGVNYIRRAMGIIVMAVLLWNRLHGM